MKETRVLTFRESLLLLLEAIPKWKRVKDDKYNDKISINLADIKPLTYEKLKWIVEKTKQIVIRHLIGIELVQEKSNLFLLLGERATEALSLWQSVDIKYLESPFLDEVVAVAKYIKTESSINNRAAVHLPNQITTYDHKSLSSYQLERALEYLENRYCIRNLKVDREDFLHGEVNEFRMMVTPDLLEIIKEFSRLERKKGSLIGSTTETNLTSNVLTLSHGSNGTLIINNIFEVAKFSSEKAPERIWEYLLKNPNRFISEEMILDHYKNLPSDEYLKLQRRLNSGLKKIIQQSKFSELSYKAFFEEAKKMIKLRNPVTKSDLQSLNIGNIPIILA